jgi:Calcium binding
MVGNDHLDFSKPVMVAGTNTLPILSGRRSEQMAKSKKPRKTKPQRDEIREERISMEIVVDAHGAEERAMGWYCYLEDKLTFPFLTRCIRDRPTSPLRVGDEVEVVSLAPEDECQREMIVETPWEHKRTLAAPLSQLKVVRGNEETQQAVEDWHYGVEMGYEF